MVLHNSFKFFSSKLIMSCFSYYSCYFWYFHWNITDMKFSTQFSSMYTPKNCVWSTCFIFWHDMCNIYSYIYIPPISLQLSTSCFQIFFDYASLSLCQCSANPYLFHILNMCDYLTVALNRVINYTYRVTRLVTFSQLLSYPDYKWCKRDVNNPMYFLFPLGKSSSTKSYARSAWLNLP